MGNPVVRVTPGSAEVLIVLSGPSAWAIPRLEKSMQKPAATAATQGVVIVIDVSAQETSPALNAPNAWSIGVLYGADIEGVSAAVQ